jgi:hypothetical protein
MWPRLVSAWWAYSCPPHDAPRRTRPAPRGPRTLRGPLSHPYPARHAASGALVIRPASDARRYRVIVHSECGSLLASLIDNVPVGVPPETGQVTAPGPGE